MFAINGTKRRIVGVGTAYVATLAILGASATASATAPGDRDLHSAICHFATDDVGSTLNNSGALTNNHATSTRQVYCPMISDDALDTDDAFEVDVWGTEGSGGNVVSRTCAHFPLSVGFVCASPSNWSAGPGEVATLSVSEWNGGSYFAYVRHDLTPGSSLHGMQLE